MIENLKGGNNSEHYISEAEQNIEYTANSDILNTLTKEQQEILEELEKAKKVKKQVELYAKRMDNYGLEAFCSLIPLLGDVTPAIISTIYLLYQGHRIGLSVQDCLKICGYQAADLCVGSVPWIGNVADFFFKGNKYSSKVFEKHVKALESKAMELGISQEKIENIGKGSKELERMMPKIMSLVRTLMSHISNNKMKNKK